MAKSNKSKKAEYAEFKCKGETFDYSGRVYPARKSGNPFIYLTLNDTLTIQCHLIEGKKGTFIGWPSYEAKKGEYKSLIFVDNEENEEIEALIEVIEKALEEIED